jgi:hypothetical protein
MTRTTTTALLILPLTAMAAIAQVPGGAARKPEASSAADFKPAELAKLAVIATAGAHQKGGGQHSTDAQRLVEDAFLECLLAKGHTLAARSDVDSLLREKKFQESGLTEEAAAKAGKILNVPAVLLVRVTDLSSEKGTGGVVNRVSLGARLVSVETGTILWTGNHTVSASTAGREGEVLLVTAAALAEAFPEKPRSARPEPRPIDPKDVPKLAVITVGGSHRPAGGGPKKKEAPQSDRERRLEDMFLLVLNQKKYKVVSRSDVQALMHEQAFQKSGLTEDNAVAAGKMLNVSAVLLVGVTEAATENVPGTGKGAKARIVARAGVGARLVDVASGEVRWAHAQYTYRQVAGKSDAADLLDDLAKEVAQFLPPDPDSARGLFERADRLLSMRQVSAARECYQELTSRYANTAEGKAAAARLKALAN